MIFMAL